MYQAPDFVKVDMNIKDNFAAYACAPDWSQKYSVISGYQGCQEERSYYGPSAIESMAGGGAGCYMSDLAPT